MGCDCIGAMKQCCLITSRRSRVTSSMSPSSGEAVKLKLYVGLQLCPDAMEPIGPNTRRILSLPARSCRGSERGNIQSVARCYYRYHSSTDNGRDRPGVIGLKYLHCKLENY